MLGIHGAPAERRDTLIQIVNFEGKPVLVLNIAV